MRLIMTLGQQGGNQKCPGHTLILTSQTVFQREARMRKCHLYGFHIIPPNFLLGTLEGGRRRKQVVQKPQKPGILGSQEEAETPCSRPGATK